MGPSLGLDDTISPPYLVRLPLSTAGSGSYDDASKPNIPSEPPPAVLDVSPVSPSNRAEHFLEESSCARKFVHKKAKKAEVLGLWQVGGGLLLDTISAESQPHTAMLQP